MTRLHLSTIETLATAIDAKDQVTHGHIRRVQQHALGLARAMGISDSSQLSAIEAAALLHDLGKLTVPEHILNKPGKLTDGEFARMKLHAAVGADILSSIRFPYPVVPIVRHHHENWDGKGYPDGLRGTQIPLGARILSVVDCFDALTSDRPYRSRLPDAEAISILMARRGTMYDPLVVDTFVLVKDDLSDAYASSLEANPQRAHESDEAGASHLEIPIHALQSDFAAALKTVLESIEKELPVSVAIAYLKDPAKDDIYLAEVCGVDSALIRPCRRPVGSHISGWVVANSRKVANADSGLEYEGIFDDSRVCLAVPILVSGVAIGAISLISRPAQRFDEGSIAFVERVAESFDKAPLRDLVIKDNAQLILPGTLRPTVH
ncbi:MAG: HD domain-containing protein [Vicinamibacterales bacterium]